MTPGIRKSDRDPARLTSWWADHVANGVDHSAVMQYVHDESGWSNHFAFMTLMSAGIAVLGVLLASPAVVIGAMLISPLMGPIIGVGFAIATFDAAELRRGGWPLLAGVVLAVLFCAAIVAVSPLQSITTEISSRTRPNLFDLLVALFAGLAGTYAVIRGRHGTIVGVAIATALMPPLAVMGFGLATSNWQVLGGSSLLFFTNLMTIAASAAVLARLYGFATGLSPHQTRLQATLILLTLIALAVPLALSLRQIAWEALASREASATISAAFPPSARVNDLAIDYHSKPAGISATVLTPEYRQVDGDLTQRLSDVIGRPVLLSLDQLKTQDGSGESAQSPAAPLAAQRRAQGVAERLAIVAGVPLGSVIVDRSAKTALVRAKPLPGATLAAYRLLEARINESAPGWTAMLVPPLSALVDQQLDDEETESEAIKTAAWASQRVGLPIIVAGGTRKRRAEIANELAKLGARTRDDEAGGAGTSISLRWSLAQVAASTEQ